LRWRNLRVGRKLFSTLEHRILRRWEVSLDFQGKTNYYGEIANFGFHNDMQCSLAPNKSKPNFEILYMFPLSMTEIIVEAGESIMGSRIN
jgi:hypothetical protein